MSEAKPRFGEGMKIDSASRLDPLHKNKAVSPDVQKYIDAGLEVRRLLVEGGKEGADWKEMPPTIERLEDFFTLARGLVTENWNKKVQPLLAEKAAAWAKILRENEDPEAAKLVVILENEAVLGEKFRIRQFGALEPMRTFLPEEWRELLLMSAERQMAEVTVQRNWLRSLKKDANASEIIKKWGFDSVNEIDLLVDMAAELGKFVDHAFIKQTEMADAPGGSAESTLGTQDGAKYIYDVQRDPKSDEVTHLPYIEVFPYEFGALEKKMQTLANRVEAEVKAGKLGAVYDKFAAYLRAVGEQFGSRKTDPKPLSVEWINLQKMMVALAEAGCPLMIVPQDNPGVAGDAEKVDVELRLGFISKENREIEPIIDYFRALADKKLQSNQAFFDKETHVPKLITNYQTVAYAPNLSWMTRGEDGRERILAHNNAVLDVTTTMALPALRSVLHDEITEAEFDRASILDNALHELGHQFTPKARYDTKVKGRLGSGSHTRAIEEMKADTGNMKLLTLTMAEGNPHNINIRNQFMAKLGDICDYLKNKPSQVGVSGEFYFAAGLAMISRLIEKGVLVLEGDKYRVSDAEAGVRALAELSDEVVSFYTEGTPEKLKSYIDTVRAKKEDPAVAAFLTKLKG